jgi:hypothetical protein
VDPKARKTLTLAGGGIVIVILGGLVYWLNKPSMTVETIGPAPPAMVTNKPADDQGATPEPPKRPTQGTPSPERSRGGGGIRNPDAPK